MSRLTLHFTKYGPIELKNKERLYYNIMGKNYFYLPIMLMTSTASFDFMVFSCYSGMR